MPSTDRPFRCQVCRRHFRSGLSLKSHYDQEHAAPRKCGNCGKQLRDDEYHRCEGRPTNALVAILEPFVGKLRLFLEQT